MKGLVTAMALAIGLIAPIASRGSLVLDQVNGPGINQFSTAWLWQQEVLADRTGLLRQLDLFVIDKPNSFWVDVYATPGVHNDLMADLLFTTLISPEPNSGWNAIDVSAADLHLIPGQAFTFGIRGATSGECCGLGGTSEVHEPSYARGKLFFYNGSIMEEYPVNDDLSFRTWVGVPEPSTMALSITALALLCAMAWRRSLRQPT